MFPSHKIENALSRIQNFIIKTPLSYDSKLNVFFKWENLQRTGSFKIRGAFNKILSLTDTEKSLGIIAASAGNHGQGVALAAKTLNIQSTIFVPANAPKTKIEAIKDYGANLISVPGGYEEAEKQALHHVSKSNAAWISPYNDLLVIEGQGTIAIETIQQLMVFSQEAGNLYWLVPVSGGGLISGIAAYVKQNFPNHHIIGVQPKTNAFMFDFFYKGTQNNTISKSSIADGLEGKVEDNSITMPLVKEYVDNIILVSESEIEQAIAYTWANYGQKIEGAGAVPLAAMLSGRFAKRPALLIVSGGNIDNHIFTGIKEKYKHVI